MFLVEGKIFVLAEFRIVLFCHPIGTSGPLPRSRRVRAGIECEERRGSSYVSFVHSYWERGKHLKLIDWRRSYLCVGLIISLHVRYERCAVQCPVVCQTARNSVIY